MAFTAEDYDLLARVEGDKPMGQIMRRHWLPACMSEEVAEPDGTPVRTRLLGFVERALDAPVFDPESAEALFR